jgi:hypothetical protein
MENESLENLMSFLEEELFLIPEDLKKLEDELQGFSPTGSSPIHLQSTEPVASSGSELTDGEANTSPGKTESVVTKEEFLQEPIPLKGNFTKGILLIHEESELSPEVMDMLVKMINACGHSMAEVGLVSSENLENRSMEDFLALNAHVVLKFGRIKHPVNVLPSQPYEIFSEGETEYLFADSLTVIAEDKNLKRMLWTSLQKLFNLSTK